MKHFRNRLSGQVCFEVCVGPFAATANDIRVNGLVFK